MEDKSNKAGVFALICSFIFPLVGIICYFVNRTKVENSSAYLLAAGGGFALGVIMSVVAA